MLSDNYPDATSSGGIGTYTRTVSRHLARTGHDVHVFAFGPRSELFDGGVVIHRVPSSFGPDTVDPARMERLVRAEVAAHGGFDVLESPEFKALGAFAAGRHDLARRFAVRLHGGEALLGHHRDDWAGPASPEREIVGVADVVTAPTHFAARRTAAVFGIGLDAVVVPNPVDVIATLEPCPPRSDVLFVGRLEHRKGVDILAQVLSRTGRHLHVDVAGADQAWPGGGSGLRVLERCGASLRHHGVLTPDRLPHLMSRCSVVVVPSRLETFGLTLVEAMMAARPVLASDIEPFREIVDGSPGPRLIDPARPDLWAKQLVAWLDHPAQARAAGSAGRERALAFAPPAIVDRLLTAWTG